MRRPLGLLSILLMIACTGQVLGEGGDNTPPVIIDVEGVPEDGRLVNPLNATLTYRDADNDNVTIEWYLDGEMVAEGAHIGRYIYPGPRNLTVVLQDEKGGRTIRSWTLEPLPPSGWSDRPDDAGNRLMFWAIFGSAGIAFSIGLGWFLAHEFRSRMGREDAPRKGQGTS